MKKIYTVTLVFLLLAMMIFGNFQVVLADNQDSFGYTYKDSNTLGGPTYNWVEINQTGTPVFPSSGPLWIDCPVVELEFIFEFYGTEYNQLSIGSQGMLLFEENELPWTNEQIASSPDVHGFIAPFWDSITLRYEYDYVTGEYYPLSMVYSQTLGIAPNRLFVVEWQDMSNTFLNFTTPYSGGVTFEALIYEGSNDIIFQYKDVEAISTFQIPLLNNGASATVGIEDPLGVTGLEYSFNQPVISSELAILFEYPTVVTGTNLFVSINAPASINPEETMTYILSYGNLGGTAASDVILNATLSPDVIFVSASEDGTHDSGIVTWNIGPVAEYPSGYSGTKSVTVEIPSSSLPGDVIETSAYISTSTTETSIDDNAASVQTLLAGLPANIDLEGDVGDPAGTPTVRATTPLTFTYTDPDATSVDIEIQLNDDGITDEPDFSGSMIGPAPTWIYTVDFYPRVGDATATFTAHHATSDVVQGVTFEVYIDPAGYIYDKASLERISGATVWLQRPNGRGGWEVVPTGENPAVMQPDVNPQTTGANGRYQWDTLAGTYRVHVEAPGYYSADSIAVSVPPPVTDLHVGLIRIPLPLENNSPEITSFSAPVEPLPVNTLLSVSANFIDADSYDKHTAIWTWADGTSSKGTITEENGIGTVTGGHIYSTVGVYEEVTLFIADSNGGSVELDIPYYIVVYDPSAGFVTGGGWINSPEGAYTIDPELMGKATFGFVSRYKKGASIPTGNTAFEFKVANLKFHSTSYNWLVIAGAKAQYKGTGTINGEGSYKFMLTAIDGKLKSELTPDTFRIKIWDNETANIIYDNQLGLSDSLDPTTIIECGSIVIHK